MIQTVPQLWILIDQWNFITTTIIQTVTEKRNREENRSNSTNSIRASTHQRPSIHNATRRPSSPSLLQIESNGWHQNFRWLTFIIHDLCILTKINRQHFSRQNRKSYVTTTAWNVIQPKTWEPSCWQRWQLHWMAMANVWSINFATCTNKRDTTLRNLGTRSTKFIPGCSWNSSTRKTLSWIIKPVALLNAICHFQSTVTQVLSKLKKVESQQNTHQEKHRKQKKPLGTSNATTGRANVAW